MKVYWISYGYKQPDGSLGLGNAVTLRQEPVLNQQGVNSLAQQVQMDQGVAEVIILCWRELEVKAPARAAALQEMGERLKAGETAAAPVETTDATPTTPPN